MTRIKFIKNSSCRSNSENWTVKQLARNPSPTVKTCNLTHFACQNIFLDLLISMCVGWWPLHLLVEISSRYNYFNICKITSILRRRKFICLKISAIDEAASQGIFQEFFSTNGMIVLHENMLCMMITSSPDTAE